MLNLATSCIYVGWKWLYQHREFKEILSVNDSEISEWNKIVTEFDSDRDGQLI